MKYIIICVIFLAGAMIGISFERYMLFHIMAKFYKYEEDNVVKEKRIGYAPKYELRRIIK